MNSWTAPEGRRSRAAQARASPGESPGGRLDPTRMANQPALRTSSGLIWVIMGALFGVAALVSFGLLILNPEARSRGLAIGAVVLIVLLYAALLVSRFAIRPGPRRLRVMAACMLSMAGLSLLGIWVCALIEAAPAR